MNIKIDKEFQNKIPPLTDTEFKQLEENILQEKEIYEPIIVWKGTIVDGHNRWKIIQKHPEITYRIKEMQFADKWDAFDWMYRNQLGRRNLTEQQRDYMIGKMYEARKNTNSFKGNQYSSGGVQNGHNQKTGRIGEVIGKELGIGNGTVRRAYDFAKAVDEVREISSEAANRILSGESKLSKSEVRAFPTLPKAEKKEVAEAIKKKKPVRINDNHKKAHERDAIIASAISNMTSGDVDDYGIDELVVDVKKNCKSCADTIIALIESRKEVVKTKADRQRVANCINEDFVKTIKAYMERGRHESI